MNLLREMYFATVSKVHTCSQNDEENKKANNRLSGQDALWKDQNVNSNKTETHTFQNIKIITKKQTLK